jgi:hypothetical protein
MQKPHIQNPVRIQEVMARASGNHFETAPAVIVCKV